MSTTKSGAGLLKSLVMTGVLGLSLAVAPAFLAADQTAGIAYAKDNGKGGGNGGGKGGGNGGSKGNSASARSSHGSGSAGKASRSNSGSQDPLGIGKLTDKIFGKEKKTASTKKASKATKVAKAKTAEDEIDETKLGSKLPGKLNAAHASPTARANAAPNSAVGQIAAYEQAKTEALASGDPEAIAAANDMLKDLTNKELDDETIDALDDLLGIERPADDDLASSDAIDGDIVDQDVIAQ